jgi:hypothetical protein
LPVSRELLWLILVDLRQAWLRPVLAALAIAIAILALTLFVGQLGLLRSKVLAGYEEGGAATFVADLSDVPDGNVDMLANAIRALGGVRSVEAPYSGISLGIVADTSFVVFQNEQQQEYLGGRTNVLGVDRSFDPARDYYINFHDLNPRVPQTVLGIPLVVTAGAARAPASGEVLVASAVADYVGVQPGAQAAVELVYTGIEPPIVRRLNALRLIGTFDVAGPDEGRFDPFWQLAAQGQEVLTVRRPNGPDTPVTTLPIILSSEVLREFLASIQRELNSRGLAPLRLAKRDGLVIRANYVGEVPAVEAAVKLLLYQRGLGEGCDLQRPMSFCLRLPERNNFQTALREQSKLGTGGGFFAALLLALVGFGTAGLQVQTVLTRWHDYGVLQAVGFSPSQILRYYGLQLLLVFAGGIAFAAMASLMLPSTLAGSVASFAWAAGVSFVVAGLAALPVLLWPLSRSPAVLLREFA